jgi:hypothetical protein
MDVAPRKAWINQAIINKREERRKLKITNIKKYRRLKELYMEEICDEIMGLQRKVRYDLVY